MSAPTESQQLILSRVAQLEKELEVAQMAKSRAERECREQDAVIGILDNSLKKLKADLDTLGYVAPEDGETA